MEREKTQGESIMSLWDRFLDGRLFFNPVLGSVEKPVFNPCELTHSILLFASVDKWPQAMWRKGLLPHMQACRGNSFQRLPISPQNQLLLTEMPPEVK